MEFAVLAFGSKAWVEPRTLFRSKRLSFAQTSEKTELLMTSFDPNRDLVIIRTISWDAMHRIAGHEGKCRALHGHRYTAEIAVFAHSLDEVGRVIDFSRIKEIVGSWVDNNWDHTAIFDKDDRSPVIFEIAATNAACGRPVYFMDGPPTVENLTLELSNVSTRLLEPFSIFVDHVRIWETPNCSAIWRNNK